MTRSLILATALAGIAGAAAAHSGAHVHPHDAPGWLLVSALLALAACGVLLIRGRK